MSTVRSLLCRDCIRNGVYIAANYQYIVSFHILSLLSLTRLGTEAVRVPAVLPPHRPPGGPDML